MMEQAYAKRFLISLLALTAAGFVLFFLLLFALERSSLALSVPLTLPRMLGIAAACALVPAGAYAGAVQFFIRIINRETLTKPRIVLLCVFLPVLLVLLTAAGILFLIPIVIKAVTDIHQSEEGS